MAATNRIFMFFLLNSLLFIVKPIITYTLIFPQKAVRRGEVPSPAEPKVFNYFRNLL